jgi:hypothetical protein
LNKFIFLISLLWMLPWKWIDIFGQFWKPSSRARSLYSSTELLMSFSSRATKIN